MINLNQIVALDLELCCWEDKSPGEIIQIGLAVLDIKTGEICKTRKDFIKPVKDDVSPYCTQLTGITTKQVKNQGRPLDAVLQGVYAKVGSNKVYVTWGEDMEILRRECQAKAAEFKFPSCLDLSLLFHLYHAQHTGKLDHRLSLEKAMNLMDLSFEGDKHDAENDAKNTARLAFCFWQKTGMFLPHVPNPVSKLDGLCL